MGYYIDPPNMSKEQFLEKYGQPLSSISSDYNFSGDKLPVCLVDNGWMTAAGIAYHPREIEAFNNPNDIRPKKWFEVAKTDLEPYYKSN